MTHLIQEIIWMMMRTTLALLDSPRRWLSDPIKIIMSIQALAVVLLCSRESSTDSSLESSLTLSRDGYKLVTMLSGTIKITLPHTELESL